MAYLSYLSINGDRQGLISAGCSTEASIGNRCQAGHTDEVLVLSVAHQLIGDDSQRALHQPVLITKFVDKATPLLAQALDSGEHLECNLNFYRNNPAGLLERYFTLKLGGAVLVEQRVDMPHSMLQSDQEAQEHLAIRYRDISWIHHTGSTSAHVAWRDLT
ncbi:Hcp family type VI secretion system effector [Pseudomonas sp. zfem004]|uniref:Hcp family type VI secretion system effector n=1 Tax=Pseudomonas sp. zfem004 TaxID=3078199 RepID=UPI002927DAD1|nr:Hcp family type VI secretion system effector [Pseudomonas sp. zfem004]MDU9404494.1 Hcp family type VI secretion system effector [Pseudomonas sp. zfem004]